ncbi:hypothetical protein PGIGA_G00211420 [Pangasianodon gigas]|uniref:Uncharacterized protein n=1 Tax=Pangasianodon gigas TaxID=30993 RepID=A0ACC5WH82_PANGG|nr:hypothetical protein [Pangasianodon gigas]
MASGCTMGRRQAGRGSVMLWAMFCWETLGPGIHVDVTLTRTTYLNIAADDVHPFMATVIGKLEEKCADLPLSYKRALSADPDDIMYTTPADVGFCYENDGRKFVSILMRFWYLTSARLPEDTMEGARIFQVVIGKNGEKPESKRLLTANYEFQREFTQGVTPDWTITRIEHSKLLD